MSDNRTFRVTVRGAFGDLTSEQRDGLLADAAQHDVLFAEFTREGHLSYDIAARPFFTFRFQDGGEVEEDILDAEERALAAAEEWLTARSLPFRKLTAQSEDLSQAPLGKRRRRMAAGGQG